MIVCSVVYYKVSVNTFMNLFKAQEKEQKIQQFDLSDHLSVRSTFILGPSKLSYEVGFQFSGDFS